MSPSYFDHIHTPAPKVTYDRPDSQLPLKGVLLEKHGREVMVQVSESRVVNAMLREPIGEQVGEQVHINRQNILRMEAADRPAGEVSKSKDPDVSSQSRGTDTLLERLQIPVTPDARSALESLEKHGLDITRGNVLALMTARDLMTQVTETMTHEKALHLLNQQVDPDRIPMQDLARMLKDTPEPPERFSFLKFLGLKKDMTTDAAEKKAKQIFGQKMGKDVADAIKALDKQGVPVTRTQVDRLLHIQEKVASLKAVNEDALAQVVGKGEAATLENLHRLQQGINRGHVQADVQQAGRAEEYGRQAVDSALTDRELKQMEEAILRQIRQEGLDESPERIRLAGVLLKNGTAVTGENLQQLEDLKEAVQLVTDKLDSHRLAALEKAGIEVEKQDIRQLAHWIREHEAGRLLPAKDESASVTPTREEASRALKQLEEQLDRLSRLPEEQLVKLVRQGGALRLEQLAPVAERINLAGLSEADQKALRLAKTLDRLAQTLPGTAALHLRREAPTTLPQLELSMEMARMQQEARAPQMQQEPSPGERTVPSVSSEVEAVLTKQGIPLNEMPAHRDVEMLTAMERQQLPLNEEQVSRMYALRGAVETLQQMTLDEVRLELAGSSAQASETAVQDPVPDEARQILESLRENQPQPGTMPSVEWGFQKLELMEILRKLGPDALVFHEKHQLPVTMEAFKWTILLLENQITLSEYRQIMSPLMDGNPLPDQMASPAETDQRMELLLQKHLQELFPGSSEKGDTQETLQELAKAMMRQQMPVNRESLQEMMPLLRMKEMVMERLPDQANTPLSDKTGDNGSTPGNMEPKSPTSPMLQQTLHQLSEWVEKNSLDNNANQSRGADRKATTILSQLESLKALTADPERRDSLLSLLIKNAIPLQMQDVRQMDSFLQNRQQLFHLMDRMMELLKQQGDRPDHPARQGAQRLEQLMKQAADQVRAGREPNPDLFRETARILRDLEPAMQQMSSAVRESFSQTGERLLNTMDMQQQLNREDTVFQLPFMLGGQMQNMQVYFLNRHKNKKIDINDMTVLLNFDTRHLGNMNVFVGVKYRKVVMKIGVQRMEDKDWIDRRKEVLEKLMTDMGYEIRDLSYRVDEEQHVMSLAEEAGRFSGFRQGRLDLRI